MKTYTYEGLCSDGPLNGKMLAHDSRRFHMAKLISPSDPPKRAVVQLAEYVWENGIWRWETD